MLTAAAKRSFLLRFDLGMIIGPLEPVPMVYTTEKIAHSDEEVSALAHSASVDTRPNYTELIGDARRFLRLSGLCASEIVTSFIQLVNVVFR